MQAKDYLAGFPQGFGRKHTSAPDRAQIEREDAILSNQRLTTTDRIILLVLERLYPDLTEDILSTWDAIEQEAPALSEIFPGDNLSPYILGDKLSPGKSIRCKGLAKKAGVTRKSLQRFFSSMHERGYLLYTVHTSMERDALGRKLYRSESCVQYLEPMLYPALLDTRDTAERVEHRKRCKERLKCKRCGSENIMVKVITVCKDCGEEQ